jgi:hypothetical protein
MISQSRPGHKHFLCEINMLFRIEGIIHVHCCIFLGKNILRKVWRYQRGNQNPYIVEGQITEWPKQKETKGQITIFKTVHMKLKIEQYESHYLLGVNSGASQGQEVPAPLVIPVCYYIYKARYRIILFIWLFCRCWI